MRFYDRKDEVETIRSWVRLSAKRMQVGVIYGRRRVGKTRLVKEALKGTRFLYFFVERKHLGDLLRDFQEDLVPLSDALAGLRPDDMGTFLGLLSKLAASEPLVVIFDEFQNFRYIDPSVFGTFQRWIDAKKEGPGLTVIFVGSMFSLMKKIFTEYKEPLYGRVTGQILLRPLNPLIEAEILSDLKLYTPGNWLRFHTVFGGMPRYYDLLADRAAQVKDPLEAIQDLIVSPFAVLKEEGKGILMEEFGKKYMVYFSILQAISRGQTTRSAIANATGLNYNRLGPYLDDLEKHYELVERRTPVMTEKGSSKNSSYRLHDNFTRFWFRYLFKYSRYIELEAYDRLMKIIAPDLPTLEGVIFENLVTRLLVLLNRAGKWEFPFDDIGSYWDRAGHEIDLVMVSKEQDVMLLAECKVSGQRVDMGLWQDLNRKSRNILAKHKGLTPVYGAFVVREHDVQKSFKGRVWSLDELRSMA